MHQYTMIAMPLALQGAHLSGIYESEPASGNWYQKATYLGTVGGYWGQAFHTVNSVKAVTLIDGRWTGAVDLGASGNALCWTCGHAVHAAVAAESRAVFCLRSLLK